MGLQIVQVIMAVEEAFDIELRDEEAERCITIGDMYWLVLAKLGLIPQDGIQVDASLSAKKDAPLWTVEKVWETLRNTIVEELEVDPKQVTLTARIVDDLGVH